MLTVRKHISIDGNPHEIRIVVKFFEDHSIKYSIGLGGLYNPIWNHGVTDNKVETAKKIIDHIKQNDGVVNITEPHWVVKILDAIIPTNFPKSVAKNCIHCKHFDEENNWCNRFDESLGGCNTEDSDICDFFEINEFYV